MSTYWGYACVSHEPPLVSEHWFNHGDLLLAQVYKQVREGSWPDCDEWGTPGPVDSNGYLTNSPIYWLREHPDCEVVLHNEYGDTRVTSPEAGTP